jgi:hypothetical protein
MRLVSFPTLSIALLCAAPCVALAAPLQHKTAASTHHAAIHTATATHPTTAHANTTAKHVSAQRTTSKHSKTHAKAPTAAKPTLAMDHDRATAIQSALIKQGYLSGEASGTWDAQSMAAMQKLQSDNGWQTKIVPDSRALIKLGLGPTSPPQP